MPDLIQRNNYMSRRIISIYYLEVTPGSLKWKAAFASRLSIVIEPKTFTLKNYPHMTILTYQEPYNKGPDLCSPALLFS